MENLLQNINVRRGVIAVFALLSVFLLAKSINEFKLSGSIGNDYPQSTIVVSGEGEVNAIPDLATFSFSVNEEKETVKEAQSIVSEKISNILDLLEKMNIDEKDTKTLSYNIYPVYDYRNEYRACPVGYYCPPEGGERVLTGYEVSQTISIKLRDIDKAGEVLVILAEQEISNLNGPNFDIENKDELEREARKKAIDDAKDKAKRLSKDLGVKLGRVVSFSDSNRNYGYAKSDTAEGYGMGGNINPAPEIPTGESEIYSFVEIVYEIR